MLERLSLWEHLSVLWGWSQEREVWEAKALFSCHVIQSRLCLSCYVQGVFGVSAVMYQLWKHWSQIDTSL